MQEMYNYTHSETETNGLIYCRSLSKIYGYGEHRTEALKQVNVNLAQGEITAIMGPSGCGKTTLLQCISGMDDLTEGEIWFRGKAVHRMGEDEKDALRAESMGFVFQNYNLIPVLTAVENVELPMLTKGYSRKKSRSIALDALGKVGLFDRQNHKPSQMSGGQQQRVALARAIVHKPLIVWADEPTGALDRQTSDKMLDLMDYLNKEEGMTFVIVTHDPHVAARAGRIIYMDSGSIIHEKRTVTER
ncbi:ABC transporter ATP-binding protein [Marinicrinis lubricantis]|uniref:ABC transporter ATP-binding protein n=1 Tax=Marinicrinis lubricantis TaxID=2086470 RepID=A0ABW1ILK3_9BACL